MGGLFAEALRAARLDFFRHIVDNMEYHEIGVCSMELSKQEEPKAAAPAIMADGPCPPLADRTDGELDKARVKNYDQFKELYRAGDYDKAVTLYEEDRDSRLPFDEYGRLSDFPDVALALGWMYEHGFGHSYRDLKEEAFDYYNDVAKSGNRDAMAGMVRLVAQGYVGYVRPDGITGAFRKALEYAEQLGTEEAKALIPVLEQKLAGAQEREAAKEKKERMLRLAAPGMDAYGRHEYEYAAKLLTKLAEQGYPLAQLYCGLAHYKKWNTDRAEAQKWLERAAAQTEDEDVQEGAKKFLEKYF